MDMEAGVEHLGRATSGSVDALVVVVNPGKRSRVAAEKIRKLGTDIGIKRVVILGNRVATPEDEQLIRESLSDFEIIGFLPEMADISQADRNGVRPYEDIASAPPAVMEIARKLMALSPKN